MSTNPLTARDKLNAKWLVLIGVTVALLGILPRQLTFLLYGYIDLNALFDSDSVYPVYAEVCSFFGYWDISAASESVFVPFSPGEIAQNLVEGLLELLCLLPLLVAFFVLLVYALKGHKASRSTLFMPPMFAGLALFWGLLIIPELKFFFEYSSFMYNEELKHIITDPSMINFQNILILAGSLFNELKESIFYLLCAVLFTVATLSWFLNPKTGKVVSILTTVGGFLLCLLHILIYYIELIIRLVQFGDYYIHSYFVLNGIFHLAFLLLYGALLILLIFNRFPPIFGKKEAPIKECEDTTTEEDTAEDDIEEHAEDSAEEPTEKAAECVVEEVAPAVEPAAAPATSTAKDEALFKLFELRASGELSAEEYRKLRDMVGEKE